MGEIVQNTCDPNLGIARVFSWMAKKCHQYHISWNDSDNESQKSILETKHSDVEIRYPDYTDYAESVGKTQEKSTAPLLNLHYSNGNWCQEIKHSDVEIRFQDYIDDTQSVEIALEECRSRAVKPMNKNYVIVGRLQDGSYGCFHEFIELLHQKKTEIGENTCDPNLGIAHAKKCHQYHISWNDSDNESQPVIRNTRSSTSAMLPTTTTQATTATNPNATNTLFTAEIPTL